MSLPQLIMRNPDITTLPPLVLPEGFELYHHKENCGMEAEWEDIIKSAFGSNFTFDFLIKAGDYKPEHVLYLSYPFTWIVTSITHFIFCFVTYKKLRRQSNLHTA